MSPTDPVLPPERSSRLGRRALLAAGAGIGLGLAGGCSLNNPFDSTKTPATEAIDDLAPDVALAVTAVGALSQMRSRAHLLVATYPAQRSKVTGLIALHDTHLDALKDAVPSGVDPAPSTPTPKVLGTAAGALKQQHIAEVALHDRLVGLALRAESGPFARLLGSMAAAISQQLLAVPLVVGTP